MEKCSFRFFLLQMGTTIESEHLSELTCTEEELENTSFNIGNKKVGFLYWDLKYIRPFFTRRFTQRELKEGNLMFDVLDSWNKANSTVRNEKKSKKQENNSGKTKHSYQ